VHNGCTTNPLQSFAFCFRIINKNEYVFILKLFLDNKMNAKQLKQELNKLKNPAKAKILQKFFKTRKGEYGGGDVFLGISNPELKNTAKRYVSLELKALQILLNSKIHEYRQASLFILTLKFEKAEEKDKKRIFMLYMKNYNNINNWDLVDLTAHKIAGAYLIDKDKKMLYEFARSKHLWKKRIAMISCYWFIKNNQYVGALKIARILLYDKHDLIHKAVGWMLREIGKRSKKTEENFLKKYYKQMPRTMLRYAIEKFPEPQRQKILKGKY